MTDAERWVAERLDALWDHPAWPGGTAGVWQVDPAQLGRRYEGWVVRAVGVAFPAPGTAPPVDVTWPGGWFRADDGDPFIVQLWAWRADPPDSPAWAERRWEPGLQAPYPIAWHDWMGLPAKVALAQFKTADQLFRRRLRPGRKSLLELTPAENPWREIADEAMALMQPTRRRPALTVPQIARRYHLDVSTIEKYLALRREERGLRPNNEGIT